MQSFPLSPISQTHFCRGGDVEIDPTAMVAPGTVIRAEGGSCIIIEAGVCIGSGVVIITQQGVLTIQAGASLGAGVLLLGSGVVGSQACIGAATTLLNPAIDERQVVAPGSLIGYDAAREPTLTDVNGPSSSSQSSPDSTPLPEQGDSDILPTAAPEAQTGSSNPQNGHAQSSMVQNESSPAQDPPPPNGSLAVAPEAAPGALSTSTVYGRHQVSQLLATLFPHRQSLNSPDSS